MKCPHCAVTVHVAKTATSLAYAFDDQQKEVCWEAHHAACANCSQLIIWLVSKNLKVHSNGMRIPDKPVASFLSWPQSSERTVPKEVPKDIKKDFTEAVRVLPHSAQSSAALTRRVLQQILRDHAHTTKKDLFDQIQEVLDIGHLPSSLADQLHAIRVIGNFAAHPLKSQSTGSILPVEPDEAEWNLDVLEDVFDYYFVKPAQTKLRLDSLNKKLSEAGKPVLK